MEIRCAKYHCHKRPSSGALQCATGKNVHVQDQLSCRILIDRNPFSIGKYASNPLAS